MIVLSLLTLGFKISAANTRPIALHQVVHVLTPGEPVVLTFEGYDLEGDALETVILTKPGVGHLYELSQVFREHQYEPKYDAAQAFTTYPVSVAHPGFPQQLVYVGADAGPSTRFSYRLSDPSGLESSVGHVLLLFGASDVSVESNFARDTEDWRVVIHGLAWGTSGASAVEYSPSSMGGGLNHFIYATESRIQVQASSADDSQLWYFVAPTPFLGNHWELYGGTLSFLLMAGSGDFTNVHLGDTPLVILECASCDKGLGIRLVYRLSENAANQLTQVGHVQRMNVPMDGSQGWLKDSKSTIMAYQPPSACEFVQVISALSAVKILGDFTRGSESLSMDTIQYHAGSVGQPIACYT